MSNNNNKDINNINNKYYNEYINDKNNINYNNKHIIEEVEDEDEDEYEVKIVHEHEHEHEKLNKLDSNLYDDKKKDFAGYDNLNINNKLGSIPCIYCLKYFPPSMFLPKFKHCGHCWGWLNESEIKLTENKYTGTENSFSDVKTFLQMTLPLHSSSCKVPECIYNKIIILNNTNKLHPEFINLFGFNKQIEVEVEEEEEENKKKYEYKIYKKRHNLNINYTLANISI